MPRDGTSTRERLLRAGARLLARDGVHGALTRDIVRAAGQSNDSAVQYHFGSRQGLLVEILDRHVRAMEEQRKPALDALGPSPGLPEALAAVVEPVAEELVTEEGRDFLRIIAQLAGQAGTRTGSVPDPLVGTALAAQLELLERAVRARLPEPLAVERVALVITMLTAALADRARRIDDELPVLLEHREFVANLVAMLTAAVGAPEGRGPDFQPTGRAVSG
ncbi:hypothetical protein GCM10023321_22910 [Pseudonocardia eucalypti]|uniref:HTH tetR-type domain-containing protein n=1 Tax=Pseudonocardia eucalypti TaxID=648755 RepID=A0ABP9PVW7_9PSEU|nr:AcrR family transcriptional regulator [Pseudonocardia eucalypti]